MSNRPEERRRRRRSPLLLFLESVTILASGAFAVSVVLTIALDLHQFAPPATGMMRRLAAFTGILLSASALNQAIATLALGHFPAHRLRQRLSVLALLLATGIGGVFLLRVIQALEAGTA